MFVFLSHSFLWLSNIRLCIYAPSSFSIHLPMVASISCLLWIILQWIPVFVYLFKLVVLFSSGADRVFWALKDSACVLLRLHHSKGVIVHQDTVALQISAFEWSRRGFSRGCRQPHPWVGSKLPWALARYAVRGDWCELERSAGLDHNGLSIISLLAFVTFNKQAPYEVGRQWDPPVSSYALTWPTQTVAI